MIIYLITSIILMQFSFWILIYLRIFYPHTVFNQFSSLFYISCFVITISYFYIFFRLIKYQKTKENIALLEQLEEIKRKQKENIETRILRNQEIQNKRIQQLELVLEKLEEHDYKKAEELFDQVHIQFKSERFITYCDNAYVNAVLQNKKDICDQLHIPIAYNVILPDIKDMDILDLPTILFNILDNAIEANKNSPNKYIQLTIKHNENYISIYMKNANETKENHELIKGMHGYGSRIVEEVVHKYEGTCEWNDHDEYFETMIMLKYQKGR